jgi:hypothetical protein
MWQFLFVAMSRLVATVVLVVPAAIAGGAGCVPSLDGLTGGSPEAGRRDVMATDGAPSDAGAADGGREADATGDVALCDAGDSGLTDGSDATDTAETSVTYEEEVLADTPLAYYRLDDTTLPVAKDTSGNGNDGTYVGGVTLGAAGALTGDPDKAISLDGTSGYVDVGDKFGFDGNASFSLEAWILPTVLNGEYRGVLTNQDGPDSGRDGYLIYVEVGSGVGLERWANSSSNPLAAPGSIGAGDWSHVVGTYDGSNLRIYVDGALAAGPFASGLSIPTHTCSFVIGAMFCGKVGFFAGGVDEVAVYGHALSAARVLVHYRVGMGEAP